MAVRNREIQFCDILAAFLFEICKCTDSVTLDYIFKNYFYFPVKFMLSSYDQQVNNMTRALVLVEKSNPQICETLTLLRVQYHK